MLGGDLDTPMGVNVDTAQVEPGGRSRVETLVHGHEGRSAGLVHRTVDQRHQVKVTDARNVISDRERASHQQIGDPPEAPQFSAELLDRGRRDDHRRSLTDRRRASSQGVNGWAGSRTI
jgi:hypothetical protein